MFIDFQNFFSVRMGLSDSWLNQSRLKEGDLIISLSQITFQ